jgi:hypothetical protein
VWNFDGLGHFENFPKSLITQMFDLWVEIYEGCKDGDSDILLEQCD